MRSIIRNVLKPFYMVYFRIVWRHRNRHNDTHAVNRFHMTNVTVGRDTYGPIEVLYDFGMAKLKIGNYCSIANSVKFFLGGVHNYKRISTFPFQSRVYHGSGDVLRNERLDIVVEDDVWIGYDSIVLPGAKIGKGSVIGARSIVTGVIPPYSVYVVNKVIKKRFSDEIINQLVYIDYKKINHSLGDEFAPYCTTEVNESNVQILYKSFVEC